MTTYKLYIRAGKTEPDAALTINEDGSVTSFVFDPANTDYQVFKADLAKGVELQDADGNVLTTEQVATFLQGLA